MLTIFVIFYCGCVFTLTTEYLFSLMLFTNYSYSAGYLTLCFLVRFLFMFSIYLMSNVYYIFYFLYLNQYLVIFHYIFCFIVSLSSYFSLLFYYFPFLFFLYLIKYWSILGQISEISSKAFFIPISDYIFSVYLVPVTEQQSNGRPVCIITSCFGKNI
jgi:hypothetical protein